MPPLISFMITRMSIGFLIGCVCGLACIWGPLAPYSIQSSVVSILLMLYGFGSTFSLGYLATALVLEGEA
jgi:hypothetical protein